MNIGGRDPLRIVGVYVNLAANPTLIVVGIKNCQVSIALVSQERPDIVGTNIYAIPVASRIPTLGDFDQRRRVQGATRDEQKISRASQNPRRTTID
jgi:hypothetical protein